MLTLQRSRGECNQASSYDGGPLQADVWRRLGQSGNRGYSQTIQSRQHTAEPSLVTMAIPDDFSDWVDRRIEERMAASRSSERASFDPSVPAIDAGTFVQQITDLAVTLRNKVEREGPSTLRCPNVTTDVGVILSQLTWTYNLLRWINADDTRHGACGYQAPYTFVSLPLVRTIIDGFYNCTSLLDDPSRSMAFRIGGYFRLRQALREEEGRYGDDPAWQEDFRNRRSALQMRLAADRLTDADLDEKKNRWPLLGEYLQQKPDTPHKQLLRRISLGLWREYSSISHASYDGLVQLFPFIGRDRIPHEMRTPALEGYRLRVFFMHFARAAVLLLCLLTEIQHFFNFDGSNIDRRLWDIWAAMLPIYEAKELYDFRYAAILRNPTPNDTATPGPCTS